jgi:hypothetical protein
VQQHQQPVGQPVQPVQPVAQYNAFQQQTPTIGDDLMIDYTLFNSDKSLMRTTSEKVINSYQQMKDS